MDVSLESQQPVFGKCFRAPAIEVREVLYPPNYHQRSHSHPVHGVSLLIAGHVREGVGRRETDAGPLSLVVKPAGVTHFDRIGPDGARMLQVLLDPGHQSWKYLPGLELGDWRWLHSGPGIREMIELLSVVSHTPAGCTEAARECVTDLVSVVAMGDSGPIQGEPPAWLQEVREAIEDLSGEGITVGELAALARVHPVYLARAFRRHYGVSVRHYRKHARLHRAVNAMTATGRKLARIAHGCGYSDQAHLCRDMRELTGTNPSAFRRMATASKIRKIWSFRTT